MIRQVQSAEGNLTVSRLKDEPNAFWTSTSSSSQESMKAFMHASGLPWLHRDPFDRLLVSQAIVHGMTVLTPDRVIARYPARTMW